MEQIGEKPQIFFQTAAPGASQYSLTQSRMPPCHLPHQMEAFFRVSFRLLRLPLMKELSAKPTEGETSERIFFQTAPPGTSQYSLPP